MLIRLPDCIALNSAAPSIPITAGIGTAVQRYTVRRPPGAFQACYPSAYADRHRWSDIPVSSAPSRLLAAQAGTAMNGARLTPPVPDQQTLALLNTYLVTMASMLNNFYVSCERQLSQVSKGSLWACLHCARASWCILSFFSLKIVQVQTSLQAAETKLALLEAQLANVQLPSGCAQNGSRAAEDVKAAAASDGAELQAQPAVEDGATAVDASGTAASESDVQGQDAGEPPGAGIGAGGATRK